jgi:uncharacterized protein (TIGR02246 family)
MTHASLRGIVRWGCIPALLFITACNQKTDTRAADEQTIRDLDAQWAKTAATRDLDATVSYYSDDAVLLPPNAPIAADRQAIRASWSALLDPNIAVAWHATRVDVSQSSDLAYLVGVYTLTMKNPLGRPAVDRGKLIEVFKKQADGKWKTVADMFNSDLPAPAS